MKKSLIVTFALLLVFAPFLIGADEENDTKIKVEAKVLVGARAASNTDYIGKVGEYIPLNKDIRPVAAIALTGVSKKVYFSLMSYYSGDSADQTHKAAIDIGRVFRQKFSYNSLLHRLDNDPLTNLDVVSVARSAVFHTNYDPNKQYKITRSEFTSESTLQIPSFSFLKFFVNYRDERRHGEYQAKTLSKCNSCHIVGKSRSIDNHTKDYNLGSNLDLGKVNLNYSYTKRDFHENEAAPTHTYLTKIHPEKLSPVFNSRIQYDSVDGPLPFDVLPDTEKQTHLFKASTSINKNMALSGHYLNSSVQNNNTGLKIDSSSLAGGFTFKLGAKGVFNARFSQIRIKNETVLVDVNEPLDVAGAFPGLTYAQAYPTFGSADWYRESALSRETLDFDAVLRYKLSKKAKFRLNYEFKKIDRDHFAVATTSSHTFKGSFDFKPVKKWKFNLSGRLKTTDHPFTNMYAAVSPTIQTFGVPNPFIGYQFYDFHRAREANLTNLPTDLTEIKATITWNPTYKFSITGHVLSRAEKNDEINFSTWENDTLNYGAYFWFAPAAKLAVTGAYYFYGEKTDSLFSIPVLEGCGGGIIGGMPGTLTDMMNYDVDTHTAFFNASYTASEKVSIYGRMSYNNSIAGIKNLQVNASDLTGIPALGAAPFDLDNVSESMEYSDLSIKQIIGDIGLLYQLSKKWALKAQTSYYFYDDLAPYLYDTDGSAYSFFLSVIHGF